MSDLDIDHFKRLLIEERARVVHSIEHIHEQPGATEDETEELPQSSDNHMAETATATVDREIDFALEENSEQVLGEIDAALVRIEAGTYGICERCGEPIGEERLEALPWASLCIDDARKLSR